VATDTLELMGRMAELAGFGEAEVGKA
jgi:hypothetical protein